MLRPRFGRQRIRLVIAGLLLVVTTPLAATSEQDNGKKPSLTLRVRPQIAIAPARIVATADLRNGADDDRDLYCPSVEWDWGDGTRSTSSSDCDPYEAGRSQIRRRYVAEKTFREPGRHQVRLFLKQGNRIVLSGTAFIDVRSGLPGGT